MLRPFARSPGALRAARLAAPTAARRPGARLAPRRAAGLASATAAAAVERAPPGGAPPPGGGSPPAPLAAWGAAALAALAGAAGAGSALADGGSGGLTWGQLVGRLSAAAPGGVLSFPAAAASEHVLELRAARGADLHAVLVALVAAFAGDGGGAAAAQVSAADAPSATTLALTVGALDVEISVPRLAPFDAAVRVTFAAQPPPRFSDDQARALERAAAVAAYGAAETALFDADGRHVACRNPRHPAFRGAPDSAGAGGPDGMLAAPPAVGNADDGARARAKLAELGVDVVEPGADAAGWDALAGYDGVKRRVEDALVLPLVHGDVFAAVVRGTRARFAEPVPRAVLFAGPPGCGKTLSARILAARVGVPFVHVPLEALLSKYYGETTQRLAGVLAAANALGRCVVFFDEVDALGSSRAAPDAHEVTRRTLSVLLRFLDGIDGPQDAILLAATNHPDGIDPALISRFDVVVEFPLPDAHTREKVFKLYAKQLADEERALLARVADGFSGREILDACEEAERAHAGRIVRAGKSAAGDNGLPVLQDYIAAVKAKAKMSVTAVEERNARRKPGAPGFGPPPISA